MLSPSLVKFSPRIPENNPEKVSRSIELDGENVLNAWSITLPRIVRFRSNFVWSLNTWRRKYHKSSKSRGQRSKSQRDVTRAKICQIVNNSAGGCSISMKLLQTMTTDLPQNFQRHLVKGQGHSVIWRISMKKSLHHCGLSDFAQISYRVWRGEVGLLYMFKVKGQRSRSRSKSSRSQRNVTYQQ